jgi:hypothetical protein
MGIKEKKPRFPKLFFYPCLNYSVWAKLLCHAHVDDNERDIGFGGLTREFGRKIVKNS